MTRSETIKRNKLISDFIYSNYNVSRYRCCDGRILKYFCNSYQTCRTIKFAVFQDYETIDVVKLIKFLDKSKIKYSEVKKIDSYGGYTSVIIRFEK